MVWSRDVQDRLEEPRTVGVKVDMAPMRLWVLVKLWRWKWLQRRNRTARFLYGKLKADPFDLQNTVKKNYKGFLHVLHDRLTDGGLSDQQEMHERRRM